MKRDLDLIRSLMLELEQKLQPGAYYQIMAKADDAAALKLVEHARLLHDMGLIEFNRTGFIGGGCQATVTRITNRGHDFLDAMRSESVWNSVKSKAAKVGSWTFELLVDCAKDEIKRRLGIEA